MADEIDIANDHAQFMLDQRIKSAMRGQVAYGPPECTECAEDMPEARRRLGMIICIECAVLSEKRQKLLGR